MSNAIENLDITIPNLVAPVTREVKKRFKQISQVISIFRTLDNDVITFWVFTDNETYDDALLEELLSRESLILDKYAGLPIAFRYVPSVLCPSPGELVGVDETPIFKR